MTIQIGSSTTNPTTKIAIPLNKLNRHGIIAGSSGSGKTVTLKVIAEHASEAGIPVLMIDAKGDLSGLINGVDGEKVASRVKEMQLDNFAPRSYTTHFFDVLQNQGSPIRMILEDCDNEFLATLFSLNDTQSTVLSIVFQVANDMDLDIIDLSDLESMLQYVSQNAKSLGMKYGNISAASVSTILRKVLAFKAEGGDTFFGMPAFDVKDLLTIENGEGIMNVCMCAKLFQSSNLYAAFVYSLLSRIYTQFEEVGDLDKPKLLFFIDEAHLLFDDTRKSFQDEIEKIVKLIRSKGVGLYFVTQALSDIPEGILSQLSNRFQHSLRAYTPKEIANVKKTAQSFRQNPAFQCEDVITSLKTGVCLASVLDEEGASTVVEMCMVNPPHSSFNAASDTQIQNCIQSDSVHAKYQNEIDPVSAFEMLQEKQKEAVKEEKKTKGNGDVYNRLAKKLQNRAESELVSFGIRSAKKLLKGLLG